MYIVEWDRLLLTSVLGRMIMWIMRRRELYPCDFLKIVDIVILKESGEL